MSNDRGSGEGPMYLPVHQVPDPTVRTIETLEREITFAQERADLQLKSIEIINAERFVAQRREDAIREAHRLELKVDSEKMLSTASIAAEKAVQAALAAAEKARDQQTIASQLATEKAEKAGKEQMEQQGVTFSTSINALNTGFNDVKTMIGELRAEKRGGQEQVIEHRAGNAQVIGIAALFGGTAVAVLAKVFGG